jgi:DNA-binding NarL/FixJ family response regulator
MVRVETNRMKKSRIRVLCVDDHPLVRDGVISAITDQPDMEVVGEAASGEEAVALFTAHNPDVTLMDLRLRGRMSGLDAIRAIRARRPEARVVVLTMYEGDEDIHRALEAGAATYLLKDTSSDDLMRIIREVHSGGTPLGPHVQARLAHRRNQPALTRRELEVLARVADGERNKEIASDLRISEETVEVHLRNIFNKLGVNDRTSAVRVASRRGIVHLDETPAQ